MNVSDNDLSKILFAYSKYDRACQGTIEEKQDRWYEEAKYRTDLFLILRQIAKARGYVDGKDSTVSTVWNNRL